MTGHFLYVEGYNYWDWETNTEKTANVYICWDGDYGEINEVNNLLEYAYTAGVVVYWDVFDLSEKWLDRQL